MTDQTPEGRTVAHSLVTMSQVVLPTQTGPAGVWAHGGEIIKLMDTAAGLAALRHAHSPVVTLRIEGLDFLRPIRVGNFVTAQARLTYVSRSTMEVQVKVMAEDVLHEKEFEALSSYFLFVAIDDEGTTKTVPPLILETEEEKKLFEQGRLRHDTCRMDEHSRAICAMD
ncbi:MAG: acyl-CoA thioesterase [Deltaproteobacteria bacterium]|nr:acyl-CoA thioesterase [Deltaproteobacteria bacterium]